MENHLFTGVCTALVTPFTDDKVNYAMLEKLLQRQVDAGIPAVVLAGTTGESATLSDGEKLEIFRFAKAFTGQRCKIIAGTGSNSTRHAAELSQAAQDCGVDGLLIVSPYYNKATPQGLIAHYGKIAEQVEIPIILYNVPGRTGLDIPVSVYEELARIPNIIGVKEASTSIEKALKIRANCPETFYLWSGNDDMTVPVISIGGKGVISVASNLLPERLVQMTDAALAEDLETAAQIQCALLPLIDLLFKEVNPIPVKAALKYIGFDCGDCRLPLCAPTNETLNMLQAVLNA